MKTCAFTGHRPQHLPFGMNENDERCVKLKEELKEQIINLIEAENVTHFITVKIGGRATAARSFSPALTA